MHNYKLFIALILIVVLLFICLPKIYGQDGKRIDVKQARLSLSTPEIVLPDINLSGLTVAKIDTAVLKQQLEIISAKRKELMEFERHYKLLLKLQRGAK